MEARIGAVRARAYTIPTDVPEADGTFAWDSTTMVVVAVEGGGSTGLGYTYTSGTVTGLITGKLAAAISGGDAMDPPWAWRARQRAVRNMGRDGLAATAISAVDAALRDLKAKLLDLPLAVLLGRYRDTVPIYGSGGFTSYDDGQLRDQLRAWVNADGCRWVKMKIGTHPEDDPRRVRVAKQAIGDAALFVAGNGAFAVKQAWHLAGIFAAEARVAWVEEPVSSDDIAGLAQVRARAPAGMEVAAGEYSYDTDAVRRLLEARAVNVLQADASRCGVPSLGLVFKQQDAERYAIGLRKDLRAASRPASPCWAARRRLAPWCWRCAAGRSRWHCRAARWCRVRCVSRSRLLSITRFRCAGRGG